MYTYDPLWETMKKRGINTYTLVTYYNISSHMMSRFRHNKNVTMNTIDLFCQILKCNVEDIVKFKEDESI